MGKTININLFDQKSIQAAGKALKDYENSLTYKCRLLAETLAEKGIEIARVQIADLDAIFTSELLQSIHAEYVGSVKGGGVWAVVAGTDHAADLLRWVAGDPIEVTAYANHKMLPIVPYDDCTIAILRFENDVIGKVFVSTGCKRAYTMRSSFYGTKGTVVCDNTSPSITFYKSQEENPAELEEREIEVDIANHNTFGEFRAFADAILNDKPVPTDALQGAKTIAACMAIVDSANERRTIAPDYNFG